MKFILSENYDIITRPFAHLNEVEKINEKAMENLDIELKIPSDVLNSFKLKGELNTNIFKNDKLIPKVKTALLKIANDFFKELEVPEGITLKDVLFLGSLANYNWSKFSDIDLHLLIDFKKFKDDEEFIKKHFDAEKNLWNKKHNVEIEGFPVEIYVQDIKEKVHASSIYSVKANKWLKKPDKAKFKVDKTLIKRKVQKIFDKIKSVEKDYLAQNFKSVIKKVDKIKDDIKQMRKAGLESGGEYSTENIVFKVLRRTEFMDLLDSYKNKSYDTEVSINESTSRINNFTPDYFIKRIPFLKTFYNGSSEKAVYFQKVVFNRDANMKVGDEIYTFPNMNTVSEFTFYLDKMDEERYSLFCQVKNDVVTTRPDNMDNLLYRVLSMAKKQAFGQTSYTKSIILPSPAIPEELLNEIINKANESLFKFEELTEGLDVKNPLDEEYL